MCSSQAQIQCGVDSQGAIEREYGDWEKGESGGLMKGRNGSWEKGEWWLDGRYM